MGKDEIRTDRFSFSDEGWLLIERYVNPYPYTWFLVFKRGETILKIQVPERIWRAFDLIKVN